MESRTNFDVVVAGGGVAGVAAALECARTGLATALVEKTVLLGGLATAGLINIYLPLCDGCGHQVIFGIAEELLHLSIRYGPGEIPAGWRAGDPRAETERYLVPFSPAAFVLALDKVLEDAGVALWLDTLVTEPLVADGVVTGVAVENKSGRTELRASIVIDATGDADVAYRAGAECVEADNWLSVWAIQTSLERVQRVATRSSPDALLEMIRLGASASGSGMPEGAQKLRGTDGQQVTQYILESHRLLRNYYDAKQAQLGPEGRGTLFPLTLPSMAQFRTTRRVIGRVSLEGGQEEAQFADSVGLAPDWRRAGPIWELPYGALIPHSLRGLLVAGRCIASSGDAWEVTRVIPVAALTGQLCGVAAQIALSRGVTPDQVPVEFIRQRLTAKGMPYRRQHVLPAR